MRFETKSRAKWVVVLAALSTLSACGHTKDPTLRSVSDFCLNDQPLRARVAQAAGADDPGNQHDSEPTVLAIFAHNAVYHSLCPTPMP